jgi:transcriptional regulator of acetoin/glycerol metabolism
MTRTTRLRVLAALDDLDGTEKVLEHLTALGERCRWNRGRMAEAAGVSRSTLWRYMRRYPDLVTSKEPSK